MAPGDAALIDHMLPYNRQRQIMARVSRGVTAHARHKKVIKRAKGYYGEEKMYLELQFKLQKERSNTHTAIEEKEKVIFVDFGFSELMLGLECME